MNASEALLLIDVQEGFHDQTWGTRNNRAAETNIALILKWFRRRRSPVLHVQHLSSDPQSALYSNQPGVEFMAIARAPNRASRFFKSP
jgi:nicotinamidase-related amidase